MRTRFCYDLAVQDGPDPNQPVQVSRWDSFVWPRWLPVRSRPPLIAQITGAVALTALIVGPWWARVPDQVSPSRAATATPAPNVIIEAQPAAQASNQPASAAPGDAIPAHVNLEVRHSFKSVDLFVSVDGKSIVDTRLAGNGKRFKVFGKRSERGFTKTLELTPGVRLVKVRVRSIPDKFDQTRVERFDLASASVAGLRVAADKSGLVLAPERPPSPAPLNAALPEPSASRRAAPAAPAPASAAVAQQASLAAAQAQPTRATVFEFLQSLRSMLIGIAGFVASTATAFIVQEWLRTRRSLIFAQAQENPRHRRRRRVQGAIAE